LTAGQTVANLSGESICTTKLRRPIVAGESKGIVIGGLRAGLRVACLELLAETRITAIFDRKARLHEAESHLPRRCQRGLYPTVKDRRVRERRSHAGRGVRFRHRRPHRRHRTPQRPRPAGGRYEGRGGLSGRGCGGDGLRWRELLGTQRAQVKSACGSLARWRFRRRLLRW
jgi:hypothetical protein